MDSAIVRIVDDIKKSDCDSWSYRGLELSNGMLVVLISHPNIDKAAAALDVNTGSLADPNDVLGTAHFLEHMLFMGSSKYPGENEYFKLIEENGGYANAYTGDDHTNYYFNINPSSLPDALDIFAQFFIAPLFAPSSTDREVEAVNSEFEGYVYQDTWRNTQLEKSTSDPQHPYSRFYVGSTETLRTIPKQRGVDVRQALLNFYQTEYSSNRMSLAVLGKQSLDELQTLVVQSFKDVPNKNLPKAKYPSDSYGDISRKTLCFSVPVEEQCKLTVKWTIPDHSDLHSCDADFYLGNLIGHESDGSILAYIRKLGLGSTLMAGGYGMASGFNIFSVDIDLTLEGINQWEKVLCIIYQYIAMLRKEGPKEWLFDELKSLQATRFQYEEKERLDDFVSHLAGRMRNYPLTECLSGPYELREFRPDLITERLNEYLIPNKMRVFVRDYHLEPLSEELLKKCETDESIPELHLPLPNDFIPNEFRLFSTKKDLTRPERPTKIEENEFYRLFYAEDSFYQLPKAYIYLDFRYSLPYADPFHMNMNSIYVGLIDDSLKEFVYNANLAGLTYKLTPTSYGVELMVNGYNHKIKPLLEKIIHQLIYIEILPEKFEIIKSMIRGSLTSRQYTLPYQMAQYSVGYLTDERQWSDDEYQGSLEGITVYHMELFIRRILARFYIDSLMYGNLTKEQAIDYMKTIVEKYRKASYYQPLFPAMWFDNRSLSLPEGCNYAYKRFISGHQLNAIMIYFQCFQDTLQSSTILGLFSYLVHQACFDQLRTKEQLGYSVNLEVFPLHDVRGLSITIQTSRKLDYVNRRIEAFLHSIRDSLSTMSDELFRKLREGYMIKRAEVEKEMGSQGSIFWNEIITHRFCFDRPQLEIEAAKSIERSDILRFYDYYISPHSTHRRKIAVHVTPSTVESHPQISDKDAAKLKNVLAIWTGKKSRSIHHLRHTAAIVNTIAKIHHKKQKLTKPPPIIDILMRRGFKEMEKTITDKEISIPEAEWINNVQVWKSKLPCYPIAQPYENINVSV